MHRRPTPIPEFPRPLASVDVVIFRVRDDSLSVLLIERSASAGEPYPGRWALPGGFIDVAQDADLESCARRKLAEKTTLVAPYLEQLGSWGSRGRDPRGWSATHAYFALVAEAGTVRGGANASDAAWHAITGEGVEARLAFDHADILAAAVRRLRNKVEYTSLPAYLLPPTFTLSELQRAYEVILERPLEKSAFRTRVLTAGLVEEAPGMRAGANRPAQLYRLREPGAPVFFPRTFKAPRDVG